MRVWPEFYRGKQNHPLTRGVRCLECPLIGERTVVLYTPNSINLKPSKKWLAASVNSRVVLLSPHHLKPSAFYIFRWLERVAWKNEVIDIAPLFSELWTVLNFKVLTSTVSVQSPTSCFQGSKSSVQRPESSVQNPGSSVQRPTLAVRVLEFRYAF